jgi:SpoVK/Ycf46/Vps4 family AAA+-type ATPase
LCLPFQGRSKLIKGTQGYCGADIEAVVKETVERKFISDNKDITTADFIETIKATKSIKDMLGKELDGLMEKNKSFNVKPASKP